MVDMNGESITKCSPEFVIKSPAGCVGGKYPKRWSWLLWMFVIIMSYIGIRYYLNISKGGMVGTNAIPHIEYIRRIPDLAKNAYDSVLAKTKGFQSSSTGGAKEGLTTASKTTKYTVV